MEKKYEAVFIIKTEENLNKIEWIKREIDEAVELEKCKITKKDDIGVRKLAYEIKGNNKGFYYLLNFETNNKDINGKIVKKIERKINTIEEVIKYIIIRRDD